MEIVLWVGGIEVAKQGMRWTEWFQKLLSLVKKKKIMRATGQRVMGQVRQDSHDVKASPRRWPIIKLTRKNVLFYMSLLLTPHSPSLQVCPWCQSQGSSETWVMPAGLPRGLRVWFIHAKWLQGVLVSSFSCLMKADVLCALFIFMMDF